LVIQNCLFDNIYDQRVVSVAESSGNGEIAEIITNQRAIGPNALKNYKGGI